MKAIKFLTIVLVIGGLAGCSIVGRTLDEDLSFWMKNERFKSYLSDNPDARCGVLMPSSKLAYSYSRYTAGHDYHFRKGYIRYFRFGCWKDDLDKQETLRGCSEIYGEKCHIIFEKTTSLANKSEHYDLYDIAKKEAQYEMGIKNEATKNRKNREEELQRREKCRSFGYADGTDEMSNCLFDLYKIEQQSIQDAQTREAFSASQSSSRNDADKLEGVAQFLQGIQMMTGGATAQNYRAPTIGTICPKSSEYSSGIYKTCVYKCVGGQTTHTVRSGELCPASASF